NCGPRHGTIAWIRGSSSFSFRITEGNQPRPLIPYAPSEFYNPAYLMRYILTHLGYDLRQECVSPASKRALLTVSRHRNGYFFSGYQADTTVQQAFKFPQGAPVFIQHEGFIEGGVITYKLSKSYHVEVRA